MKLIYGDEEIRNIPLKATRPLDGDKTEVVTVNASIIVADPEEYQAITNRWTELSRKRQLEEAAIKRGDAAWELLSDDERKEASSPAIYSLQHLINDVELDIEYKGETLTRAEKIDFICKKIVWLRESLFTAVLAVQSGKTSKAFSDLRAKNS